MTGFQISGGLVTHSPRRREIPMEQVRPYVVLYAIDIPTDPRTKVRLAAYPQMLPFERDSMGIEIQYIPFAVTHGGTRDATDGNLPVTTMIVQNVTREMSAFLEAHSGLEGEKVRIVVINKEELPDGNPTFDDTYDILESEQTDGAARFKLGQYSLFQTQFPNRRISRVYCGHPYARAGCGYDAERPGSLQTCSKIRIGTEGCEAHGDDEVAAGLARRHPARMLVFEGIARASGVGVS